MTGHITAREYKCAKISDYIQPRLFLIICLIAAISRVAIKKKHYLTIKPLKTCTLIYVSVSRFTFIFFWD